MKKILVTTDFSSNSKAGLRFAIQLAAINGADLSFFHSYNLMIPTSWSKEEIKSYKEKEVIKLQEELNHFVKKLYKQMEVTPVSTNCILKSSPLPQSSIMDYAKENDFDFICISTRGAGKFERFLGTNTANLIIHSEVPVIAVPHNYKVHAFESILYASDLLHLEKELKKVVSFAEPLKAEVELLHFTSPLETMMDAEIVDLAIRKFSEYNVQLNIQKVDYVKSLVKELEKAISKSKPSMLIMFTEQNRSLFQRLFLSSKSAEYSFNSKIPLLVFNKS